MTVSVIDVVDFRKSYGDLVAVDGISFEVRQGEIFGLLGPNGAGKTSTLESLEGLRAPDGGSLRVAGIDPVREPRKLRDVIGVQLQTAGLPDSITPSESTSGSASSVLMACWMQIVFQQTMALVNKVRHSACRSCWSGSGVWMTLSLAKWVLARSPCTDSPLLSWRPTRRRWSGSCR